MKVKFKVGQKVRIGQGNPATRVDNHFRIGDIATVKEIREVGNARHGTIYQLSVDGYDYTQILAECQLSAVIDYTKPLFTAEGTPVVLVTTSNPRDAKFPVLVYEGKASLPTKYTADGFAKNGVARRNLTNELPKKEAPAPKTKTVFVNLFDMTGLVNHSGKVVAHGGAIGNGRFNSAAEADAEYASKRPSLGFDRVGVAKVEVVKGRMPVFDFSKN